MKGYISTFIGLIGYIVVIIGIILGTFFIKSSKYILGEKLCGNCLCEEGEEDNCGDCFYNFTDSECPREEMDWIGENIMNAGKCPTSYCVVNCSYLFEELRYLEASGQDTSEIKALINSRNCDYLCEKIWKKTKSEDLLMRFGCYHYDANGMITYIKSTNDI